MSETLVSSESIIYGRKFTLNKFGQLSVPAEKERAFLKECDDQLSKVDGKKLSAELKSIATKHGLGETIARTILKIHERNFKPPAKVKEKKGQLRFTQEEIAIVKAKWAELKCGPTQLHKMKLLGGRNPSVPTIHNWLLEIEEYRTSSEFADLDEEVIDEMAIWYEEGLPITGIVKKLEDRGFNISKKYVDISLKARGIDLSQGREDTEKLYLCKRALDEGSLPEAVEKLRAEGIKISETQLRRYFHELDLEFPPKGESSRIYSLDQDFFNQIDTEEKAYILGLIATDGNIFKNIIKIELKRSDKELLQKLRSSFKTDKPIYNSIHFNKMTGIYSEGCCLVLHSSNLVNSLLKYNLGQRKTLSLNPDLGSIPKELHKHFWRGVVDGDGCLTSSPTSLEINLVGTKELLEKFIDEINSLFGIKKPAISTWKTKNCFTISYYAREKVNIIIEFLYKNSNIYLQRKFETAKIWWENKSSSVVDIRQKTAKAEQ